MQKKGVAELTKKVVELSAEVHKGGGGEGWEEEEGAEAPITDSPLEQVKPLILHMIIISEFLSIFCHLQ